MKKAVSIKEVVSNEVKNSKNMMETVLKSNWSEIVGKALSGKSMPYFIKDRTLYISVENSAWTQQMQFLKNDIINKINQFLNGAYISELIFKNSEIKRYNYNIKESEDKNKIDTNQIKLMQSEESELKSIAYEIENEEIREKFYKILVENKKREIYLMKEGYIRCERCLSLFHGEGNVCFTCLNEEKQQMEKDIVNYIIKNPAINFMKIKEKFSKITKDEYIEIKKKTKDRVYREVMIYIKEKKFKEAREKVKKFYMIELESENMSIIDKKAEYFIENMSGNSKS